MVSWDHDIINLLYGYFIGDHGMGSPERAVEDILHYKRWREGLGFQRGTVVQVKTTIGDYVVTRIDRVALPHVYVNWIFRETPRLIRNVLPLFPAELQDMPEPWCLPVGGAE